MTVAESKSEQNAVRARQELGAPRACGQAPAVTLKVREAFLKEFHMSRVLEDASEWKVGCGTSQVEGARRPRRVWWRVAKAGVGASGDGRLGSRQPHPPSVPLRTSSQGARWRERDQISRLKTAPGFAWKMGWGSSRWDVGSPPGADPSHCGSAWAFEILFVCLSSTRAPGVRGAPLCH